MTIERAFRLYKFLGHFMPNRVAAWIMKRIYRAYGDPYPWDTKPDLRRFIKGCAMQGLVQGWRK